MPILSEKEISPQAEKPPLPPLRPEVAPFETDLLPAAVRDWADDVAARMSCPKDFLAVGGMVTMGAALGNGLTMRPKARDCWTVPANLWGAVVAPPSAMKTPALAEMVEPLRALDATLQDFNRESAARFELETERHKLACDEARKAARKNGPETLDLPESPEPPGSLRAVVNNATSEKLGLLLSDNPRGLLLFRDEVSGWLAELDKTGREGERGFFLEAFNGTSPFTFDRIGRGTLHIPTACASILGGIQPGPFADLLKAEGSARKADGLLQRFSMLAWPNPHPFTLRDDPPDAEARREYHALIERLFRLNRDALNLGAVDDFSPFPFLRFEPDAQRAFNAWLEALMNRLQSEPMPDAMAAHLSKYRKALPALALLSQLADNPTAKAVGAESWSRAERWGHYLESHARRVYAPVYDTATAAAHKLANRFEELPAKFTAREIYLRDWEGLTDSDAVRKGLEVLAAHDWLNREDKKTGGRPTAVYTKAP